MENRDILKAMLPLQRIIGKSGLPAIFVLSIVPIFLWFPFSMWTGPTAIFRSLGQITALVGSVLLSLNFILATRWNAVEYLFMGLNRAYVIHHLLGAISFILLIFHPLFLIFSYIMISPQAAATFIIPSPDNLPVLFGTVALLVLAVLLIITFYINMEYDAWKKTHIWLGLPLFIATVHAFIVTTTFDESPVLKYYMFSLFAVAIYSFVYRIFRKYIKPPSYDYTVGAIDVQASVILISLNPVNRHIRYEPGQFAYIQFFHRGIAQESHPFSIVTSPESHTLIFAIKSLGDYTETLKLLEVGAKARIEGAYGRFSYKFMNSRRYVWIAGGIGVTPFLSMIQSLKSDHGLDIDFFYCVRDEKEALFLQALKEKTAGIPGVRFTLWQSATDGRFSGIILKRLVPDLDRATVLVCGPPPMMQSLKTQLQALGIKKRRIISEEFSFQ